MGEGEHMAEKNTVLVNGKRVSFKKFATMTGLRVESNLDLSGCTGLTALPDGLTVGGYLYLNGCTGLMHITSHPGVKGLIYR
jgi:hypothetical protein